MDALTPDQFFARLQAALVADPGFSVGRDGVLEVETYAGAWHVVFVSHLLATDPPLYVRAGGWPRGADWTVHTGTLATWAAQTTAPAGIGTLATAGDITADGDDIERQHAIDLWTALCVEAGGL